MSRTKNAFMKIENLLKHSQPITVMEALFYQPNLPDKFKILLRCQACGEQYDTVDMTKEKFDEWIKGKLIQDVFPDMSAEYREMFITGIGPCCWNEIFKPLVVIELDDLKEKSDEDGRDI